MSRDDRVEQIREREQKATNGPWIWYTSNSYRRLGQEGPYNEVAYPTTLSDGHPHIVVPNDGDLEFIAHAREDVSYLLDRLRAAEERVRELECSVPVAQVHGFYDDGTPSVEWTGRVAHGDVLYRQYDPNTDAAREALTEDNHD